MAQITIEVTDEAARAFENEDLREYVTALANIVLGKWPAPQKTPFAEVVSNLTDAEIDAALAAANGDYA